MLTTDFPDTRLGGMQTVSFELCKAYVKLGHEVIAIVKKRKKDIGNPKEIEGIKMYYVNTPIDIIPEYKVFTYSIRAFNLLKKLNKEKKLDIVHAMKFSMFGLSFLNKKNFPKTKFITSQYETGMIDLKAKYEEFKDEPSLFGFLELGAGVLLAAVEKPYLKKSDRIITEDWNTVAGLKKMRVNVNKVDVIPNGVDLEKFNPKNIDYAKVKKKYNIKSKNVLVYAGRLCPRKGTQYVIRAMPYIRKEIPDAHIILAGGTRFGHAAILKNLVNKMSLNECVTFTGRVGDDLQDHYGAGDIIVFTPVSEGIPVTLMEAMACSRPVVCTSIPGIVPFIGDRKILYWAKTQNVRDIAKQTIKLLKNSKKKKEFSVKGRKFAEEYSWIKVAKRQIKVFENMIQKKD